MRILLVLAGLAISAGAASQEIYRWVDRNGQVHYSDQPGSSNAELISVIEPNAYDSADAAANQASGSDADDAGEEPAGPQYDSLAVTSPSPDQVFFGADAVVTASAELSGTLSPDHSLVFFLNGNRHPAEGLSTDFTGLARGTYFLRAAVLDENGNPLIQSPQTTFHVRQPSINSPQSPQAPRPPPRPTPRPTPTPRSN